MGAVLTRVYLCLLAGDSGSKDFSVKVCACVCVYSGTSAEVNCVDDADILRSLATNDNLIRLYVA